MTAFYFHIEPWFVVLFGGWAAASRRKLSTGWGARSWGAVEALCIVVAFVGFFDPHLVRWHMR